MPGSARAHSREGRRERSGAWAYRAATWNKSVGPEGPPTASKASRHEALPCIESIGSSGHSGASKAPESQAIPGRRKHRRPRPSRHMESVEA
ncbi:DUF6053 domain-containing protein [Lysobacter yananisis]|uniref:DUF6053 domain-containing protein n=1 Tax=Lysobacter yananisis TaxID=1003114 RepID=UPI003CE48CE2